MGPSPASQDRVQVIDEYGELHRQIKLHEPVKKRYQTLQGIINSWYVDHPADQPAVESGQLYELQISARRNESSWKNKLKIWKLMGGTKAISLWDIARRTVQEALSLSDAQMDELRVEERTGYRTITPVPKVPAQQQRQSRKAA